jgi:hypothetical protein
MNLLDLHIIIFYLKHHIYDSIDFKIILNT